MSHRTRPGAGAAVVAIALIALASLLAGCDWSLLGPRSSGCNTSSCWKTPHATPGLLYMLRGDTVRFTACDSYTNGCGSGTDTGNILAKWSVPDSNVVTMSHGSVTMLVPSATSVLVRGIAPGQTTLSVTFAAPTWTQTPIIHVADSSAITAIELPSSPFTPFSDTLRIGGQAMFDAHLKDVAGNIYSAWPESLSVSDSTVLRLTRVVSPDHVLWLRVDGLKSGTASLKATFRGVTATRQITVVP